MYKNLIRRKLAYMMHTEESIINAPSKSPAYQRFDSKKREEIVVWIRQLVGLDKDQIKNNIQDKFNVSDEDAERLYYEAYPDGLSSQEEEIIDYLEILLPPQEISQISPTEFIDTIFLFPLNEESNQQLESYDAETITLFSDFIKEMLLSRKMI